MHNNYLTSVIAKVTFLIGLITLIGCVPATGVESTAVPETTNVLATAVATETIPPTEIPLPTDTPEIVSTTESAKMSPTDPPKLTEEAPKPTAPDSAEPAIIYERSGGFAGLTDRWQIYSDGRITYNNGNNRVMEWQAEPADVAQLHEEIVAADFFALESSYVPKNACCDLFTYSLTVTNGTQTLTTSTVDQEPSTPDNLWMTLEFVQTFIMDNTDT